MTLEELKKEREEKIKHLLYPHQTVLDDSIGCALWFASRGKGKILDSNGDKIEYVSNAEVLLLGMGVKVKYSRRESYLLNTNKARAHLFLVGRQIPSKPITHIEWVYLAPKFESIPPSYGGSTLY